MAGSNAMQINAQVPFPLVNVLQGLIILLITTVLVVDRRTRERVLAMLPWAVATGSSIGAALLVLIMAGVAVWGTLTAATAAEDAGFEIDEAEVIYWGRCPDCRTTAAAGGRPRSGGACPAPRGWTGPARRARPADRARAAGR